MKYHYYIGLQLPPLIRERITQIQKELFDPIESVEPLEPHITLLPPPAVENIPPDELAVHARAAALSSWPLLITLNEVITFQQHAVALRADGGDELHGLQGRLVDLLPFETEVQYYPDPKFIPHVTLVQSIRGNVLSENLINDYKDRLSSELPIDFMVDHLTLFEWTGPRQYIAKKI